MLLFCSRIQSRVPCFIYSVFIFLIIKFLKKVIGTSLVVQWLRLHAPNAGGLGSIPGQGTKSHMLQLIPSVAKL